MSKEKYTLYRCDTKAHHLDLYYLLLDQNKPYLLHVYNIDFIPCLEYIRDTITLPPVYIQKVFNLLLINVNSNLNSIQFLLQSYDVKCYPKVMYK